MANLPWDKKETPGRESGRASKCVVTSAGRYEVMSYAFLPVSGATESHNRVAVATALAKMGRMTDIEYRLGDATAPVGHGRRIICHIVYDIGRWGKGFVVALSRRWPQPEAAFREWYADRNENDFALGAVQLIDVGDDLWVANLVGQSGIASRRTKEASRIAPVRYEAIETGLARLATVANELRASVHMPRIGCGLAGGTWDLVEPIIQRKLCAAGVPVTVYDLE